MTTPRGSPWRYVLAIVAALTFAVFLNVKILDYQRTTTAQASADNTINAMAPIHAEQVATLKTLQPALIAATEAAKAQLTETRKVLSSVRTELANQKLLADSLRIAARNYDDSVTAARVAYVPVEKAQELVERQWRADSLTIFKKDSALTIAHAMLFAMEKRAVTAERASAGWQIKFEEEAAKHKSGWAKLVAAVQSTGKAGVVAATVVTVAATVVAVAK